ncbi:hypothetical protein P4Q63_001370 [Salmonella enterica]|nr:hypothetical protein [Salmonella enterica]
MSDVVAYFRGNFHREVTQVIRPFTELFPEGVSAPGITDGLFPLRYALALIKLDLTPPGLFLCLRGQMLVFTQLCEFASCVGIDVLTTQRLMSTFRATAIVSISSTVWIMPN